MEYLVLAGALIFGAVYVAVLVNGLEKNKTWAREIALTIALMEPSRGYMDYSHLRRGPEHTGDPGPDAGPDDPNAPTEQPAERADRLAA